MLLATAAEPARGWGGPIALLAAFLIFRIVVMPAGRWVMSKIGNPSPPPALPTAERVKAQATVGSTSDGSTEPEVGWWGRIVEVGGVRVRQARQVWRTGSHELPAADDPDEDLNIDPDTDPDIDLALDGEEDDDETVEEYIARARGLKLPYNQIVKVIMEYYDLTEATAKYRIRKVDADLRS
jgi:hypothetical protein